MNSNNPMRCERESYVFVARCAGESQQQEPAAQAAAALAQLTAELRAAGSSLRDLIRLWVWCPPAVREAVVSQLRLLGGEDIQVPLDAVNANLAPPRMVELAAVARKPSAVDRSGATSRGRLKSTGLIRPPVDAAGRPVDTDLDHQIAAVFKKLEAILTQEGAELEDVGHMLVWYESHSTRDAVNKEFLRLFPRNGDRPCRHSVVRDLPDGEYVQIEVMFTPRARARVAYTISAAYHRGIAAEPNSLPWGTRVGDILYSSGIYGGDLEAPAEPVGTQAERALDNTETLLWSAGMTLRNIGHAFIWVADETVRAEVEATWTRRMSASGAKPATTVLTSHLPGKFKVQYEIIAVEGSGA